LNNVNLLPRKPLLNQIYIPLVIAMVVVFFGCSFILLFFSFNTDQNMEAERKKIEEANKRIAALTVLHQVDPRTQDYDAYAALLQQLTKSRRDWTPVFELITKNLYKSSRLLSMEVNDKAAVSVNLEFAALNEVAYYTILLQNSPLIEQVSVKGISITKKSKEEVKLPLSQMKPGKLDNPIQTTTLVSYLVTMELQLKSLVSGK
jgi:hypothetical protein